MKKSTRWLGPVSAIRRAFDFQSSNLSSIQQVGNSLCPWQIKCATSISSNCSTNTHWPKKIILNLCYMKGSEARIKWSYDMHALKQMNAHSQIPYYPLFCSCTLAYFYRKTKLENELECKRKIKIVIYLSKNVLKF